MGIEGAIYDTFDAAIGAAVAGAALNEAELHDTLYARITRPFGLRIGDVEASLAPLPGGAGVGEFDATVPIQCFSKVLADTAAARAAARDKATALAHAAAQIFFDDTTLGGRVRDSLVVDLRRGWAQVQAAPYAVAVLMVLVNSTGQQVE